MERERKLMIGGTVIYIDARRVEHVALVNCIHGDPAGRLLLIKDGQCAYEDDGTAKLSEPGKDWPCINLLIVSPNEECQDQYGRQIERNTSVVHQSNSSALGMCYRFMDEALEDRVMLPPVS